MGLRVCGLRVLGFRVLRFGLQLTKLKNYVCNKASQVVKSLRMRASGFSCFQHLQSSWKDASSITAYMLFGNGWRVRLWDLGAWCFRFKEKLHMFVVNLPAWPDTEAKQQTENPKPVFFKQPKPNR